MTKFPRVDGHAVIAALTQVRFEVVRVKGSHNILRHSDGRVWRARLSSASGFEPETDR